MSVERVQNTPTVLSTDMQTSDGSNVSLHASGDTNLKPPDYHLPFTGDQVVEALWKIINLDLKDVGGISQLPSDPEAPFNLDTVTTPGNYVSDYISGATVPEELQNIQPINISVVIKTDPDGGPNTIIQVIEAGGNKWYRWSNDEGITWSPWAPKPTNSGEIDTSGDVTADPPKDPITEIKENIGSTDKKVADIEKEVSTLKTTVANSLRLGSTEVGTQIMNGTYDYDTVTPA